MTNSESLDKYQLWYDDEVIPNKTASAVEHRGQLIDHKEL